MKEFKGKAIYNPSGKAGEYSYWACNFYVGCSNGCTYCYLKKGRGKKHLGGDKPKLKACFGDENHAMDIFEKELSKNRKELEKTGLFFTFTSDNMLKESMNLLFSAVDECYLNNIPVKILTKRGLKEIKKFNSFCDMQQIDKKNIAIGYTLTNHDELEPFAAPNLERINSVKYAKERGYKTFASIEPIIDFESSKRMIIESKDYVDLFKIGLESGKKYDQKKLIQFVHWLIHNVNNAIYLKDSITKKLDRLTLPSNFVNRDYNLFK